MTKLEAFEKLAKNNGLNIKCEFYFHRAWFKDKDYIISMSIRDEYQTLNVASKVRNGKFMRFEQYRNISQKVYTELDKQIKQLIGEFKEFQVEEKLENMRNDFE